MKYNKSRRKVIRAVLIFSIFLSFFQNINIANADGNGLRWYWRTDSGATNNTTTYGSGQLAEFTTGTCHTIASDDINWTWGTSGPGGNCGSDGFTTFGTGFLYAPWTGTYTFCNQSDDGFYLRIDSTEVIINWVEQGAQTGQNCNVTRTINLNQGQTYSIKVFHHENGGGADMRLLWKYSSMTSYEIVPQRFLSTANNFSTSITISDVLPFYGLGNTTYNFGPPGGANSCGSNQTTGCVYTISSGASAFTLTYSLIGNLPNILIVNSSTGNIQYNSGGTFTAGTYSNLKIRATDANGATYDSNSFSIYMTQPLNPTFGTYTRTADGFTVQITNYDAAFTWAGTATANGTVSISGSGLVTVSGVAPGTNSIATITTTRIGYSGGSAATTSTQSLLAQSITWSPTTTVLVQQSPLTPSSTATVLDGASVSYSITNAGSTGCTINSSSAVLSFIQPGNCVARVSASATSNYASATRDVTFTVGSISANPVSDTTTAGLTTSFSITTIDTPSATTRSIKWQVASDTITAAASVSWSDVSSGSGFSTPTFTTNTLTTAMNKYRYRAIVTFVSARGTSVETTTIATLTINPAISITSTQTTITKKYGVAVVPRTVTFTGGTDTKTVSASATSLAGGKITFDNSTGVFSIDTGTAVGTYYDTITVTDAKGATASYTQVITSTVADSLTVQADTLTAITYSPNSMAINPITTITGLVNSDTQSAITFTYKRALSCAEGGLCNLGDTGPGGGIIFYDAGSNQSWGRYIEATPIDWYLNSKGGSGSDQFKWCTPGTYFFNASGGTIPLTDAIGFGRSNRFQMSRMCFTDDVTNAVGYLNTTGWNGRYDWFLPTLSEMDALNNYANGALTQKAYWVSADTSTSNAVLVTYSNWPSRTLSSSAKSGMNSMRPMRYVTPLANLYSSETTSKPTNAGTYIITPKDLVLANNVDTSNYVTVLYQSSEFIINKAPQDTLNITSKMAPYNGGTSTMKLTTSGGTDTGTVTYTVVSGGTASGCSVSTNELSYTSVGTCKVVATKAATLNYLIAYSDTVTITLSAFVSNQQVQTQSVPTQLPINGANSLETSTVTAALLTITGVTNSGGGAYTIAGTGFTNVSIVRIGGTDLVLNTNYTVTSTTAISITNASGLVGPLFIYLSDGQQAVRFEFPN